MPDTASGAHILVIEDDVATRDAVARNLSGHGYAVVPAGSVAEGLRAWDAERPDLILLDLGLPGGGGLLVLERLRAIAELAATPVIVVTARTDAAGEQDARAAGAVDFLRKPVEGDDLAAAIERALG